LKDIPFVLTAKNDCQDMKLSLSSDEGDYWFTLWGNYRGDKRFQVDFDAMTKAQLSDLKAAIDSILEL
jgi:hypothetical protein